MAIDLCLLLGGDLEEITIPKNIKDLGFVLFQKCNNLKKVTVLGQPVNIGKQCFYGLNYPEIDIDFSKVEVLKSQCFFSRIIFKNPIINLESLKSVSDYVFYHQCITKEDRLKGTIEKIINYPLDYIPRYAFSQQMNLKEFDLSNIKYIYYAAFTKCQQLKVNNLNSAVYIGDQAFNMLDAGYPLIAPTNRQITVSQFPNAKYIGYYSFDTSYPKQTVVNFENSCNINVGAFSNTQNQFKTTNNLNISLINPIYGIYRNGIQYDINKFENISKISFVLNRILPELTANVNFDSFKFLCETSFYNQSKITELRLNNVKYICTWAIWGCKNLKSIYFGNKFEDIYWGGENKKGFVQKLDGLKIYFNGIEATPEQYDFLYTGNLKNMTDRSKMMHWEKLIIKYITENEEIL